MNRKTMLAAVLFLVCAHHHVLGALVITVPQDAPTMAAALTQLAPHGGTIHLSADVTTESLDNTNLSWNSGAQIVIDGNGNKWTAPGINLYDNMEGVHDLVLRNIVFAGINIDERDSYLNVRPRLRIENCSIEGGVIGFGNVLTAQNVTVVDSHFVTTHVDEYDVLLNLDEDIVVRDCTFILEGIHDPPFRLIVSRMNSKPIEISGCQYFGHYMNEPAVALYSYAKEVSIVGNNMPEVDLIVTANSTHVNIEGNRFRRFHHTTSSWGAVSEIKRPITIAYNIFGNSDHSNSSYDLRDYVIERNRNGVYDIHDNTFGGFPDVHGGRTGGGMSMAIIEESSSIYRNNFICGGVSTSNQDSVIDMRGNWWRDSRGPSVYNVNDETDGAYLESGFDDQMPLWAPYLSAPVNVDLSNYGISLDDWPLDVDLRASTEEGDPTLDVQFTARVLEGVPPYEFYWFVNNDALGGGLTRSTLSYSFSEAGRHIVRVAVEDADGQLANDTVAVDVAYPKCVIFGSVMIKDTDPIEPVPDAIVTLSTEENGIVAVADVNEFGGYEFRKLPPGEYHLIAEALEYQDEEGDAVLRVNGDKAQIDFEMFIPLDENRRANKYALIPKLKFFPQTPANPGGPEEYHPYYEIEFNTRAWLDEKEEFDEAFKRLELAEAGFYQIAALARMSADESAQYLTSMVTQGAGMISSIFKLNDLWKKNMPAVLDLHSPMIDAIADKGQQRIWVMLMRVQKSALPDEAAATITNLLKPFVSALSTELGLGKNPLFSVTGYLNEEFSTGLNKKLQLIFLQEYGDATKGELEAALARAQQGPPFGLNDYKDSRAFVGYTLRMAQGQYNAVQSAASNIDTVNALANTTYSFFGFLGDLAGPSPDPVLKALIESVDVMYRSLEIFGTSTILDMNTDLVRNRLPRAARMVAREAFGDIASVETMQTSAMTAPGRSATTKAPRRFSPSQENRLEVARESESDLLDALSACRAAMEADDPDTFKTAFEGDFLSAMKAFDAQQRYGTRRIATLAEDDLTAGKAMNAFQRYTEQTSIFLIAGLSWLAEHDQGNGVGDPVYLQAKWTALAQAEACSMSVRELGYVLGADVMMSDDGNTSPVLAAIDMALTRDDDGRSVNQLAESDVHMTLTAEIANMGGVEATDVEVALDLQGHTGFTLTDATATQTLTAVPAGDTETVTWELHYDGPTTGSLEMLSVLILPSESRLVTEPIFLLLPSPLYDDRDNDGMDDHWEWARGLNSEDPDDGATDWDQDGLTALEEFLFQSNPNDNDTDDDGLIDSLEREYGLDPRRPDMEEDADGDGLSNGDEIAAGTDLFDRDSDDDGFSDGIEIQTGSSPTDSGDTPTLAQLAEAALDMVLNRIPYIEADALIFDANGDGVLDIADYVHMRNQ